MFKKNDLSLKLKNFSRFVSRRYVAKFLNHYEIYKKQLNIHGSIIDCGVNQGFSLFNWFHFSNILEPYNSSRLIFGFDTFDGFKDVNKNKKIDGIYSNTKRFKELRDLQNYDLMLDSIKEQNQDRALPNIKKIEIIKGNATKTIPKFVKENKYLLISLLHLDFDTYKPTKIALKEFLPRMASGSIIAFDEINNKEGPGETIAMIEEMNIKKFKINRNYFDSYLSYVILE